MQIKLTFSTASTALLNPPCIHLQKLMHRPETHILYQISIAVVRPTYPDVTEYYF